MPRNDDETYQVIEPEAGETYKWDGKTYAVYEYGVHEEWSVLAGQEKRSFLDSSTDVGELKRRFPKAEVGLDGSGYVPPAIPHTAPEWFDPANAGEVWDDEDY